MTIKTWTLTVNDEGVVIFPEELLEHTGWNDDTLLEWHVNENGSVSLSEVKQSDLDTALPEHES
jgi:bifunctional DNA-binding transcriptional regulator/antitoxin component of YhaV-PrlF toxin-antitoxin module